MTRVKLAGERDVNSFSLSFCCDLRDSRGREKNQVKNQEPQLLAGEKVKEGQQGSRRRGKNETSGFQTDFQTDIRSHARREEERRGEEERKRISPSVSTCYPSAPSLEQVQQEGRKVEKERSRLLLLLPSLLLLLLLLLRLSQVNGKK